MDDLLNIINRIKTPQDIEENNLSIILDAQNSIELYKKTDYKNIVLKTHNKVINNDNEQYLKPWIKLDKMQKINRLMLYIKKYNLDKKKHNHLQKILIEALNEKKLCRKNEIVYDELKGIIIDIKELKQNKHGYFYLGIDISNLNITKTENTNKFVFKKLDIKNLVNKSLTKKD